MCQVNFELNVFNFIRLVKERAFTHICECGRIRSYIHTYMYAYIHIFIHAMFYYTTSLLTTKAAQNIKK